LTFFQTQPEGLDHFFHPAALLAACVEQLHGASSALRGEKVAPVVMKMKR